MDNDAFPIRLTVSKSHTMRAFRLLFVALLQASTAFTSNAETLGRLFFTPQDRAVLDRARQGIVEKPDQNEMAPSAPPKINGYVARSDGQVTLWVDNEPKFTQNGAYRFDPSAVGTSNKITVYRSPHYPINKKNESRPQ